jgi:2-polyprenyl-6-methoxyphenol hydroxylase-like FAD-dependent oxidoreductase
MDVLIAGAGPVGLMMGCELARRGIPFRIIDKSEGPSVLSKAIAIHARTLETFDLMGIIEPILQKGKRVNGLNIWMGEKEPSIKIELENLKSTYPFLLDLPQSETEKILIEYLSRFGKAVERGTELLGFSQDEDKVHAVLRNKNGQEEEADFLYLIGCDGSHSTVRHKLEIPFEGSEYPESFVLADVKVTWDKEEDTAHVFLTKEGIMGAFPYGHSRYRIMADIESDSNERKVPEPTLEQIQAIVDRRGPINTKLSDAKWLGGFRSHLRHVTQTRHGRVFLVGDAAHIHSPAGGQGLNTGVQDAFNLAWKLAMVLNNKASKSLLDTFEEERLPVAETVLKMSDMMLKTMTNSNPFIQNLRKHIAPLLMNKEFIQKRMRNQVSEIAINYRNSSIVEQSHFMTSPLHKHRIHAGDRLPDVTFQSSNGKTNRLYEFLRSTKHTLLLFSADLVDIPLTLSEMVDMEIYLISSIKQIESPIKMIIDEQHEIQHSLGVPDHSYVLIRPDGYLSFVSDNMDFHKLEEFFTRVFLKTTLEQNLF